MKKESVLSLILSDFQANKRNWKGFLLLLLYRLAHAHLTAPFFLKPFTFLYLVFYKLLTELILGTEIHWRATIGRGARLYHGYGLVINSATLIGENVILRHGTTIGEKEIEGKRYAPIIGDNVNIGASSILLGKITIGDNAVIGAGSVVVKDVAAGTTVAGNPARVLS